MPLLFGLGFVRRGRSRCPHFRIQEKSHPTTPPRAHPRASGMRQPPHFPVYEDGKRDLCPCPKAAASPSPWEAGHNCGQAPASIISLSAKLVGQLFSAFCSSAGQNFAAISSRHSFSETVLFFSLQLLRLVCSPHDLIPSLPRRNLTE